jgi:uncharacterized membrane protein YeaQ/YmgE (transglycosylase-associated protein family)
MDKYLIVIACGVVTGFLARWIMLRSDYRHYPTYPHGQLIHLALGFIAASLGAVAVPAIMKPDYTAVTFLVLAAQQFRDVRNMERENLTKLEETKLIRRGNDYIEGIARVFEARNYLVIFTAFITSLAVHWWGWPYAFAVGPICIFLSIKMMSGNQLGDIVEVVPAKVHFEGSLLMVSTTKMITSASSMANSAWSLTSRANKSSSSKRIPPVSMIINSRPAQSVLS